MKNIIETSLEFSRVSINAKTIFDPTSTSKSFYFDISGLSGITIKTWFDYEENGVKKSSSKVITIPPFLTEEETKNYILSEITQ